MKIKIEVNFLSSSGIGVERVKQNSRKLFSSRSYCNVGRFRSYFIYFQTIERDVKNYKIPIEDYADNKSLHDALQSSKYVTDKCLGINIGALEKIIFNKEIKCITWIKSAQQIEISLTKYGANLLPLIKVLQKCHFQKTFN